MTAQHDGRARAARRALAAAVSVAATACALSFTGSCSSNGSPSTDAPGADAGAAQDAAVLREATTDLDGALDVREIDAASLLDASAAYPAVGSTTTCPDVHPRLTFSAPVALGAAGKIQLWGAEQDTDGAGGPKLLDTIDIGATAWTTSISGREFNIQRPVWIDGNSAVIAFKTQAMMRGGSYFVTVDDGVFVGASSPTSRGRVAPGAWSFAVSAVAPASPSSLTVAADGSGDFCTVQGAIDAISAPNPARVTVTIKKGTYREIVFINRKTGVTLHGEDRKETVIAYANNNTLNPHTNTRAMVEAEGADGLIVENLTLKNLTPQGVSQAEALRVEPSDQVILRDADFLSTQDTLLLTGRVYVTNCYVEGNVDFIWGKGTAYFDHCELKTVGRAGYEVQSRNAPGVYGYVFVDSTLTATPGITGNMLGRIDASVYPASQVAYLNCKMDGHIDPKGWVITGVGADGGTAAGIRFAEYQSTNLAGQLLDVSLRIPESKQLTDAEAALMRDKTVVLGGWDPTAPAP